MRRVVPWALVGLLGVGVVLGAAFGAAGSPRTGTVGPTPAAWLANVLAATNAAGTAHLAFTGVTASANPVLRASTSGTGVVDFAAGSVRTTEVQHQIEWSIGPGGAITPHPQTDSDVAIGIGSTLYQSLGALASHQGWVRLPLPRATSTFGLTGGAAPAVLALSGAFRVVRVRALGHATLDGTATTRYLVRSELRPDCPRRPVPRSAAAVARLAAPATQSTTVWIDDRGRLVQARASSSTSGRLPASMVRANPLLADRPPGSTTTTTTLRLSSFGAPVSIAAPVAVLHLPAGGSVALATSCAD